MQDSNRAAEVITNVIVFLAILGGTAVLVALLILIGHLAPGICG